MTAAFCTSDESILVRKILAVRRRLREVLPRVKGNKMEAYTLISPEFYANEETIRLMANCSGYYGKFKDEVLGREQKGKK